MKNWTNVICISLGLFVWALPAFAEVKDYQIRRLIYIHSSCHLDGNSLKRTETKDNGLVFHGVCQNTAFFPDGIKVSCPDPMYDIDCKIVTKPTSFDQLNLFRDSVNR